MKKLYFFLLIIYLSSCTSDDYLSPEDLNNYISKEKNELSQKIKVSEDLVKVTYRPADLLIHQEANSLQIDSTTYNSLRKKYANYYYFILSLSKENKEALNPAEGLNQYSELVQTLSFRMDQYVSLVTSAHDTIPTAQFILNRTFGLSGATDILFAFHKEKTIANDWVEFTLKEFGLGIGDQRFRFARKNLEGVPKINFEIMSGKPD